MGHWQARTEKAAFTSSYPLFLRHLEAGMRTATTTWHKFIAAFSTTDSKELYKGCEHLSPAEHLGKLRPIQSGPLAFSRHCLNPLPSCFSAPLPAGSPDARGIGLQAGDGAAEQQSTARNSARQTSAPQLLCPCEGAG